MKKIYVSLECSYPCIPEVILTSSADALANRLKATFPHVDVDIRLTDVVSGAILDVDKTVQQSLGGAWLPERELRLFVDVALEKKVMSTLSSSLAATEEVHDTDPIPEEFFWFQKNHLRDKRKDGTVVRQRLSFFIFLNSFYLNKPL